MSVKAYRVYSNDKLVAEFQPDERADAHQTKWAFIASGEKTAQVRVVKSVSKYESARIDERNDTIDFLNMTATTLYKTDRLVDRTIALYLLELAQQFYKAEHVGASEHYQAFQKKTST